MRYHESIFSFVFLFQNVPKTIQSDSHKSGHQHCLSDEIAGGADKPLASWAFGQICFAKINSFDKVVHDDTRRHN